jgi:hypothetical protein
MKKNISLQFNVAFERKPEKEVEVAAYAFDQKGKFLTSAPVKDGKASLKVSEDQAKRLRLFFAPVLTGKRAQEPTLNMMARLQAYAPSWRYDPKVAAYNLPPVPEFHGELWYWCRCRVRGQVVRPVTIYGTTTDKPVCYARVHVCEVDPVCLMITRLPDDLVWRLRDELLHLITTPEVPPIPPRPEPDGLFQYDSAVIDPSPENITWINRVNAGMTEINPQPEPPYPIKKMAKATGLAGVNPQPEPGLAKMSPIPEPPQIAASYSLPPATKAQLSSGSLPTVKKALLDNADIIRPYLCHWPWVWPLVSCEELEVLYTDAQGRFDADISFLCLEENPYPDLYFWVDY